MSRKGLNSQEEEVTLRGTCAEVHQGVGILAREIGGQDFSACVLLFDRRLTGLLFEVCFYVHKMTG